MKGSSIHDAPAIRQRLTPTESMLAIAIVVLTSATAVPLYRAAVEDAHRTALRIDAPNVGNALVDDPGFVQDGNNNREGGCAHLAFSNCRTRLPAGRAHVVT